MRDPGVLHDLNFFAMAVPAVLILYASRTLGLGAGGIGIGIGIGIGGVLGAATATRLAALIGTGCTIAVGAILFSFPASSCPSPKAHRLATASPPLRIITQRFHLMKG